MIPTKYEQYNPKYLDKGKRSEVFTFKKNNIIYCIKAKRKESKALNRLENEAYFLKILNKYNIGPKLVDSGKDYIVYEFVKGKPFLEVIEKSKNKFSLIKKVLDQCFIMDKLKINKEEMHHPRKHIYVFKNQVRMIDFERCHFSDKVHNVTQFFQYILTLKLNNLEPGKNYKLIQEYQKNPYEENYKKLLNQLKNKRPYN